MTNDKFQMIYGKSFSCLFIAVLILSMSILALAVKAQTISYRVETIATGLEVPWSIAFAPDGRIFVTERPGRLRVIENGKLKREPLYVLPDVEKSGETGLMGMTLHPDFAKNRLLYLAYAYGNKGRKRIRVARFRETGTTLVEKTVIIENIPAAKYHAGCRLRFGPDGKLYISTGDATEKKKAQKLDALNGKFLRVNDDGTIPQDNPFINHPGGRAEVWTYGNRNSQGFDWQPETNLLFATEHGPSIIDGFAFILRNQGGDEVNIIERGKNYGWPTIHHQQTRAGMESPFLEYTPAIAPAGATFYRGSLFPNWRGGFFFACLKGEMLVRVALEGKKILDKERMFEKKYGRLRDVAVGPDGAIYFATSNRDGRGKPTKEDDRILRIVPNKQ